MGTDFSVYDSLPCCVIVFRIGEEPEVVYSNKVYDKNFDSKYICIADEDKQAFLKTVRRAYSPKQISVKAVKLGGEFVFVNIVAVKLSGSRALAIMVDNTETHEEIERLKEKLEIDPLSKLYTRETAIGMINERLENMEPCTECAFVVLDIDNFKRINDTFGHMYGDAVIAMAAGYIKRALGEGAVVGRFGGDEFFFFIDGVSRDKLEITLQNIILEMLGMRNDPDNEGDISCSMGIAIGHDGTTYGELFRQADSALYAAKQKGKNRYEYFSGEYLDGHALNYTGNDPEREKSLDYTSHDLYTIKKFREEAGRINREARERNDNVAVIHFDFKYFYKFNRIYGKTEGDRLMALFSDFLLSGDETKAISAAIAGTDIFISFVRYPKGTDICPIIEEKLNEFCAAAGEYKEFPPVIKAGMCSFEPGKPINKAIDIAKNAKRGLQPDRCVCVEEKNVDFEF